MAAEGAEARGIRALGSRSRAIIRHAMTVVSDLASDYSPSGFFVIRTPLLPFSDLVAWGSGLTAPGLDMTSEALADDRNRLRERLRE